MPENDLQRLEIANGARTRLALENELSASQARSYVRCLQIGWQVDTIGWNRNDSEGQLADARSLLQAAEIFAEIEGNDARAAKRQRGGNVHRSRRFTRTAFFVGEDNTVRRSGHQVCNLEIGVGCALLSKRSLVGNVRRLEAPGFSSGRGRDSCG